MKAVIDFDGTISADPGFCKAVMRGLVAAGNEVHVLTGNPTAQHLLAQLGMVKGRDFTHLAVIPRKRIAATKVAYMRRVGATHMVDNRHKNIRAARVAGFTADWHRPPKGRQ